MRNPSFNRSVLKAVARFRSTLVRTGKSNNTINHTARNPLTLIERGKGGKQ